MLSAVQRQGIQRKLLLTFVPLILVIIFVLAFFLLRDFSSTILAAVYANGEGLADRTASVVKANPGDKDRISLDDYFCRGSQEERRRPRGRRRRSGSRRSPSTAGTRRRADSSIWASTNRQLINGREPKDLTLTQTTSRYNPATESYEFLAPVTLSNIFIGYVMVDYARDVIYEPYFRTQVKVFVIAALFMYASIFLIYLFGRNIVFPILFLRMSVNSIADKLSSMIKGKLRFSSELLQYNDRVRTRDEIKLLSGEVNHMTTVIRGVIPYISQSTLKHSERETPTTERRTSRSFLPTSAGSPPSARACLPTRWWKCSTTTSTCSPPSSRQTAGTWTSSSATRSWRCSKDPKKELNACKTALAIRQAMAEEKELSKLAGARTAISIGIGINSGPVVHGSMGAKDRMDFTSIGDTVNLAARLEGTNKEYGTKSLITAAVYEKVKDQILCRKVDNMTVKGKTQAVVVYEILQEIKLAAPKLVELKELFEKSLDLYWKQKWDEAEKSFASLLKIYKDETSAVFLERVKDYRKNPPPRNWDEVFHRTSK